MNALMVVSLVAAQAGAATPTSKPAPVVSPELADDGRVTFRLVAPQAREVTVVGVGVGKDIRRKEDGP